jgi:glucose/arabinose dehydrogenase
MTRILFALLAAALPVAADAVRLPEGFHLSPFARDLGRPHTVLALEDGTVLVSRPDMNDVLALRDRDGDGRADEVRTAVAAVENANGLAMRGRTLYIAGVRKLVAAERMPDGSFAEPVDVVTDLPDGGRHPYRSVAAGPDGKIYLAVSSSCASCKESNPEHATILQMDADGANRRIYARGIGEAMALTWIGDALWAGDAGEINRVADGLHFGWPLCRGSRVATDTGSADGISPAKFCGAATAPAFELKDAVAPRALVRYDGAQYPEDFRGNAFLLLDGRVDRVRFDGDRPAAAEPFASGLPSSLSSAAVAQDGSLLLSDTEGGAIHRIAFGPPPSMASSAADDEVARPVLARAFAVSGLRAPYAVLHDEEQDVYFVANGAASEPGRGFVSRVTPDGSIAELTFVSGLDAPRGMAIRGAELWVTDGDKVRVFDRVTGTDVQTIDLREQGAVFLHDIAAGPDDSMYVTDPGVAVGASGEAVRRSDGRVFRVDLDGSVEIAASGEELRSPTGIAWDGARFLIAQSYGREVLSWMPGTATRAVLRGPGAFDGLVVLPNGAVIVSSHHDEAVHLAYAGGELRPLFSRKPGAAGIGFDRKRNRLLLSSPGGDRLEAWSLPPIEPPRRSSTSRDGAIELARQ